MSGVTTESQEPGLQEQRSLCHVGACSVLTASLSDTRYKASLPHNLRWNHVLSSLLRRWLNCSSAQRFGVSSLFQCSAKFAPALLIASLQNLKQSVDTQHGGLAKDMLFVRTQTAVLVVLVATA